AVPINVAKAILPQLVEQGRVIRPWVGIRGKLVRKEEFARIFTLPIEDGFLVETVEPGSPAAQSGIQGGNLPIKIAGEEFLIGGDIVISANGKPLSDPKNYENLIKSLQIGDKIRLKIFREGQQIPVEIVIVERPLLPWDVPTDN
ncbi:MAG: PDZ domain-containing protein, partial [Deltaproteobacteria bacterium]|nr:PDZ domain-containing protein [Deltaproteobacteria bacterium]